MVKIPHSKQPLSIGKDLIWFLVFIPLFWGCQQERSNPPFPGTYELMVEEVDSVSWNDWLDHWSTQGHPAMQFEVRALRSLLDEWPVSGKTSLHVAWYRIGPDRWSVLIGTDEKGQLPFSDWQEEERSSYRLTTTTRYRTANGQIVWLSRRSGWQLLAFQRSLLQDALLANPAVEAVPSSSFSSVSFMEKGYLNANDGSLGFRQKPGSPFSRAFAKKDLVVLPDFLREGQAMEPPALDWFPTTDLMVFATGLPLDNKRKEMFLWISDATNQWDSWWERNRTEKGALSGFSHQGIRVHQVLDERWQRFLPPIYQTWMPAPFVVRFNDGWILSNSEEGIKRWMDYLLVQKTFQAWLPALSDEALILGWTHSDSEFGQKQRAKIGPLLPKGKTWFWVLENGRCKLAGANPEEGQSELLWQTTDIVGPVRYWQFLSNTIFVLDQRTLHQWTMSGTPVWRQPLAGDLLGAIQKSQVGEEVSWMAGTAWGLYAWDVSGQPLTQTPFQPSTGQFLDWTHRLGTDRRLYRFALESSGQIRGIVGRGIPATGWPRQVEGAAGLLSLRTETEDALVVLGSNTWKGFTLDGYDRWEIAAPAACHQWVTGPESGAALIRLSDNRLVQLSLSGAISEIAQGIDTLVADPSGRYVVVRADGEWALWTAEGIGGTYRRVRTLERNYSDLSVQLVSEKPWLARQSGNGIWQMVNLESPMDLPELPGRIAPLIWRRGEHLVVLIGQEDKVVAYQLTPE